MAQTEQDRLIERYLAGGMSAEEESDFFVQLALHREMQLELRAHRVIDSAIGKEKESERTEHSAMRARMAALAAVSPALNTSGARTPADSPSAGALTSRFVASSGWIVASVLAVLLAVGAFLVAPWEDDPATDAAGTRPAPAETAVPEAANPNGAQHGVDNRQNSVASEPTEIASESAPPVRPAVSANNTSASRRDRKRTSAQVTAAEEGIDGAEGEIRADEPSNPEPERVREKTSEELEIQVRINPKNRSIGDEENEN